MLFVLGLLGTATLSFGPLQVAGVGFDISTMVYTCLAVLTGAQLLLFGVFALLYGHTEGITNQRQVDWWGRWVRFETCTAAGLFLILLGLAGSVLAVTAWGASGFGAAEPRRDPAGGAALVHGDRPGRDGALLRPLRQPAQPASGEPERAGHRDPVDGARSDSDLASARG